MKTPFTPLISFCLLVFTPSCNWSSNQFTSKTIPLSNGESLQCTYDKQSQLVSVEQFSADQKPKLTIKRELSEKTEIISFISPEGKRLAETTIRPDSVESGITSKLILHSSEWDAHKFVNRWAFENSETILIISNYFPRTGKKAHRIFGPLGVDLTKR